MQNEEDLTGALCASLQALAAHLEHITGDDYVAPAVELGGSSIGQHVRHCLDHFETLRTGLDGGRLDYDERARDTVIEREVDVAANRALELCRELGRRLDGIDLRRRVEVRTASGLVGEVAWQTSSLGRELQFLVSHMVHHAAMIAAS